MKLSIMFLTYNRPMMAQQTLIENLCNIGLDTDDYELLICDQGSDDTRFVESLKAKHASYVRLNKYNEGIARSLNQLIIRAKGKHLFFLPNDFLLPPFWALKLIAHAERIEHSGIVGFEGQDLKLPEREVNGLNICMHDPDASLIENSFQVFGPILITRELVGRIGGFCEDFHPYGLEDSDLCLRCIKAGLLCYYIPGLVSKHIGDDGANKDNTTKSFFSNAGLFRWRARNMDRIGLYEPLPIGRDEFI